MQGSKNRYRKEFDGSEMFGTGISDRFGEIKVGIEPQVTVIRKMRCSKGNVVTNME